MYYDDIVLVRSEPGIHGPTNINKLLQVRHTTVRPGEVIDLWERERERERKLGNSIGKDRLRLGVGKGRLLHKY